MSDLRDEIRAVLNASPDFPSYRTELVADAVLRVVGERLLSDEAVDAGRRVIAYYVDDIYADADHLARRSLSAAWRVVTGSNHA